MISHKLFKSLYNRLIKIVFGIVLFISLSNCQKLNNGSVTFINVNGQKILVCDVDKITETREMNLSELVETSYLIRLSNDTNALIGNTWLEKYSSGYFIVAELSNKLSLFNQSGQFINSWYPGKGPDEYVLPEYPQIVNGSLFIKDKVRNKLQKYNFENNSSEQIDLIKKNGKTIVLNDSNILSFGNSESHLDPYLLCVQDFNGSILNTIKASNEIQLNPPLVHESVISYKINNGWNIHFPTNDTLMHYNLEDNNLNPEAVFYSKSSVDKNKALYEERKTKALSINNIKLTQTIQVVPEYENEKYYFISVYTFGMKEDLPWYFADRKMCLIDKETEEVFFINLINDFWGNIPFQAQSNSHFWEDNMIQVYSAFSIKNKFSSLLGNSNNDLDAEMKTKLNKVVAETKEDDNNLVFFYKLKN